MRYNIVRHFGTFDQDVSQVNADYFNVLGDVAYFYNRGPAVHTTTLNATLNPWMGDVRGNPILVGVVRNFDTIAEDTEFRADQVGDTEEDI